MKIKNICTPMEFFELKHNLQTKILSEKHRKLNIKKTKNYIHYLT